jgi:hypothetical protein
MMLWSWAPGHVHNSKVHCHGPTANDRRTAMAHRDVRMSTRVDTLGMHVAHGVTLMAGNTTKGSPRGVHSNNLACPHSTASLSQLPATAP